MIAAEMFHLQVEDENGLIKLLQRDSSGGEQEIWLHPAQLLLLFHRSGLLQPAFPPSLKPRLARITKDAAKLQNHAAYPSAARNADHHRAEAKKFADAVLDGLGDLMADLFGINAGDMHPMGVYATTYLRNAAVTERYVTERDADGVTERNDACVTPQAPRDTTAAERQRRYRERLKQSSTNQTPEE